MLVLVAMTALGPMTLNIIGPTMPGLQALYGVSYQAAQSMVYMYLFAFAVAQLFYGPLSDRYGRRPMTLIGLSIFLVGSLLTLIAGTIEVLAAGRALQALGGCAGMALARAAIRDVHDRAGSASMIGYVTSAMVIAPMLASPVGGWLFENYGLRSVLAIPMAAGVATLVLCLFGLHETLAAKSTTPIRIRGIVAANFRILRHQGYRAYAIPAAFSATAYYIFVACSPFVSEVLMGVPPSEYGLWFLALSVTYMIGNWITGRFGRQIGSIRMIWAGYFLALFGIVIMSILAGYTTLTAAAMFSLMGFLSAGNGLSTANSVAGALSADPTQAGAASGMTGFLQMTMGAIGGILVSVVLEATRMPLTLALGMMIPTLIAIYVFASAKAAGLLAPNSSHSQ